MYAKHFNGKLGWFMRYAGGIPIPENKAGFIKFNEAFDEFNRRKQWMLFFPESVRWNWYQPIRPFKKGAFSMAYKYNAPIIPTVITYRKRTFLYKLFGINAELLIDHAWGWEPCTIADIKAYKPATNCLSSGQVLHCPYDFETTKIVLKEMLEALSLDLVEKKLVTDQIVITIGYDIENLTDASRRGAYKGEIKTDFYGRQVPKHARGTVNIGRKTSSTRLITDAVLKVYDEVVNSDLLIRRINITANNVIPENTASQGTAPYQLSLFETYDEERLKREDAELEKERKIQETLIGIKNKFGKNAILKGLNLQEGATAKDRNEQIGGHKA